MLFHALYAPDSDAYLVQAVLELDGARVREEALRAAWGAVQERHAVLRTGLAWEFASAAGALTAFLDRAFFAALGRGVLRHKPGAAVVSCRRGGSTAALDQLLKYFSISEMPVISSQYWNMVHGNTPEEVRQDLEGLQTMRILGANMAWLLRSIEAGKAAGVPLPERELRIMTNFVR